MKNSNSLENVCVSMDDLHKIVCVCNAHCALFKLAFSSITKNYILDFYSTKVGTL